MNKVRLIILFALLLLVTSSFAAPLTSRDLIIPVYSYEENFESFSDLSTEGWISPTGVTGTIRIVSDPTGSGRNNLLELQDIITANSDIGAVVYSPVIDTLKTAKLTALATKTNIYLDFYFAGSTGRWFVIGKTSREAFVMNDPSSQVDAYANSHHDYIPIVRNKWYSLKIIINKTLGTYDVEVTDPVTLSVTGTITGKAFDTTDNYDSMHFSGSDSSDGRLMFGSWFSYSGCPDKSYGHVYIDNIKVQVEPAIQLTPASLNFNYVPVGSVKDLFLTVKNTGGGTLTGNATTTAPFSIVSDGSYSLGPDQSQVVTIRYQPTSPGTHIDSVVFTGGGGVIVSMIGKTWAGLPWLLLLLGN